MRPLPILILALKICLVFLFVLLICGCSFLEPKEIIRQVPVEVQVPCKISPIEKPYMPFQNANPSEDFGIKLGKALAEIEIRKGYEIKLEAAIEGCQ